MIQQNPVSWIWRFAFPASLILNCFLIAWVASHGWHVDERPARILANIERNLDPQDAAAFRGVMQRAEPRLAVAAQQVTDARRGLREQLLANPYDPAAAKRALATWRAAGNQFLNEFGDTVIDALGQVSPEGRRKVVSNRSGS
jgi:uncharacterized membrane protein